MTHCPYCGTTSAEYEQSLEDHIAECRVDTRRLTAMLALTGAAVVDRERNDCVPRAFKIADEVLAHMEADAK